MRTCQLHSLECEERTMCPLCQDWFDHRPDAKAMTPEARAAEMRWHGGDTESPGLRFEMFHERVEELVGRPVWTHELGLNWEGLVAEAGGRREAPTLDAIIDLIPEEKRVIVVASPPEEKGEGQ